MSNATTLIDEQKDRSPQKMYDEERKKKIPKENAIKGFNAITFCLISLQSVMVRKREQP